MALQQFGRFSIFFQYWSGWWSGSCQTGDHHEFENQQISFQIAFDQVEAVTWHPCFLSERSYLVQGFPLTTPSFLSKLGLHLLNDITAWDRNSNAREGSQLLHVIRESYPEDDHDTAWDHFARVLKEKWLEDSLSLSNHIRLGPHERERKLTKTCNPNNGFQAFRLWSLCSWYSAKLFDRTHQILHVNGSVSRANWHKMTSNIKPYHRDQPSMELDRPFVDSVLESGPLPLPQFHQL